MSTIGAALTAARQQIEASEARLLLCHLLGHNGAWLEVHRDDVLDSAIENHYAALVARRYAGEPIAYITGTREFYGRDFYVAPGVLIPRPETELIVDTVLEEIGRNAELRILDMGTGSGCLAITLALELPRADVTALDVSPVALAIARRNAGLLSARVRLLESDWFAALGDERFDLVVSNPPYVAANDPHLTQGDLRFEPAGALASGSDGLDAIRHIVENAPAHLNPGARLLLEHGYDQAGGVRRLLETRGFQDTRQYRDLAGIVRISDAGHI